MLSPSPATTGDPAIELIELDIRVRHAEGVRELLSSVSLTVPVGGGLALVGESGCGKSLTCQSLTRLLPEPPFLLSGSIRVVGRDVLALSARELRQLRGGVVGTIFQDPGTSLNPVIRVGEQVAEAIRLHDRQERDVRGRVEELFRQVGIPEPAARLRAWPHELSGGMQQRVMIAMALACRPAVLVADEPTTALDVTVQAQVLDLLKRLQAETGAALLLVTHNLALVADLVERVAIMYAGQVVETGLSRELLRSPRHPYTKALLAAVPRMGSGNRTLATIPGRVPLAGEWPSGCRFAPRCPFADAECAAPPPWHGDARGWQVRCHHPLPFSNRQA